MSILSNSTTDFLVILGPTATGKTKLAVQLANKLDGEIISADSRQVYKSMDIGTGKDLDDYWYGRKPIPYHLIDIADPMEEYNVAQFQKDFYRVYSDIKNRNKLPILCGGSGFYIKVILMNYKLPTVGPDKMLRKELETWTLEDLIQELENILPGISTRTLIDTKRRAIRLIEVEINSGNGGKVKHDIKNDFQDSLIIGVEFPRQVIRERITRRLHERLENGMIQEVKLLIQNGVTYERLYNMGLEYRFISRYLQRKITKDEMVTQLNTAIHRFAKKQMTFFRHLEKNGLKIHWIPEGNFKVAFNVIRG